MALAYLSQSLADIERTETMSSSISHLSSQSNSACLTIFRCLFPHGLCTVSRKMQWRRLGRTYEHLNLCDKVEIVRRRTSQRRTCRPRVITGTGGVELIPASMASSKSRGLASTTIVRISQCLVAHPPTCGELSGLVDHADRPRSSWKLATPPILGVMQTGAPCRRWHVGEGLSPARQFSRSRSRTRLGSGRYS